MLDEIDLSKAISEVQQMLSSDDGQNQLQSLIKSLSGGEEKNEESTFNEERGSSETAPLDLFSGLGDAATLLKIKSVMDAVGSGGEDSNAAFLKALKPFLKEERRRKLDSAAKILTVTKALKAFKDLGIGGV
ncbi:MAG: hypothetical protein IJV86_05135 [Clostridia bacterium]|nr:hypothetical protein [Clostridia bacterium]